MRGLEAEAEALCSLYCRYAAIELDAAQERAHAGQHFTDAKELADIIIGSDFQAKNAVNLLIAAVSIMMDAR